MILIVLSEGGSWQTLNALREYGGGTYFRQSRGSEAGEETVEDRKTTDLPAVRERERPKDSASSREIPMILNALVSTA